MAQIRKAILAGIGVGAVAFTALSAKGVDPIVAVAGAAAAAVVWGFIVWRVPNAPDAQAPPGIG